MRITNLFSRLIRVFCLVIVVTQFSSLAFAKDKPVGTVVIDETQFMLFVGGNSGSGTLKLFDGTEHEFKIEGVKIGGVGMHNVHLKGNVYYMDDVSQFEGEFLAAEIGGTLGIGRGGYWVKNENGVVLHLFADAEGLALNLGFEGVNIKMVE